MVDVHDEKTFAEQYELNADEYIDVDVVSLPFTVRVQKRLDGIRINNLCELLNTKPEALLNLPGFGLNCFNQIDSYIRELKKNDSSHFSINTLENKSLKSGKKWGKYVEHIKNGDFSFADIDDLNDLERHDFFRIKEAYSVLGEDLVRSCLDNPGTECELLSCFSEYINRCTILSQIKDAMNDIPDDRKHRKCINFITAFSLDENDRDALLSFYESSETELYMINAELISESSYLLVLKFFRWCSFNLLNQVKELFEKKIYKDDRIHFILDARAKKCTLEEVGQSENITRERVRQLENKARHSFEIIQKKLNIVQKIFADNNGEVIITHDDVVKFCGPIGNQVFYLLKNVESESFYYDSQLDVIVVGDQEYARKIALFLDDHPQVSKQDDFKHIISCAIEESLPGKFIQSYIETNYKLTGNVYHKTRLTLASVYEDILIRYFPNGVHIYDEAEISKIRSAIWKDYGDIGLPENDRAITARISSIGMLSGRGIYKPKNKDKTYISNALAEKLHIYIHEDGNEVVMMNTLYYLYRDELSAEGVDNKYFLQGILKELFGDELVFRRDYVSKNKEFHSIYSSIISFIKESKSPVSKKEIKDAFPGITDIVINMAIDDEEILNFFGEYLHASRLVFRENEVERLKRIVDRVTDNDREHHIKEVFEIVTFEQSELLSRNFAKFPFCLQSILEYLFTSQYQFSRPYLARKGIVMGRAAERLHEYIYSEETVSISDISAFSRDNHYQIQSLLDYANSCNDKYLMVDNDTLKMIDELDIDKTFSEELERILLNEVVNTMPIRSLQCWGELPKVNVPWTDWLLYSILNKWSKVFDVGPSNSQLRQAVPLIAPKGKLDIRPFVNLSVYDNMRLADDLNNIDDLLEDIIGNEILEGNDEL